MGDYQTIYADPPWPERGGGRIKRGADRHYPLMKVDAICEMADFVTDLSAPNAHLYLWATNTYLPAALRVMEAWGFRYITLITWAKDRMGLGQYYRGQTEHCLFCVKGRLPYRNKEDGHRAQGLTLIYERRTRHSRKPAGMRAMIERVSHEPRIELFAREQHEGWDAWGNEVDGQRQSSKSNRKMLCKRRRKVRVQWEQ